MPRINVRETNPERYARLKEEQEKLLQQYAIGIQMARLCPHCEHKLEILYRGAHGSARIKCNNCGEESVFPPVSFRFAPYRKA